MPTTTSAFTPMPSTEDQRWLAVLAGKQQPNALDPGQRQAAQLRGYFAQRDAHELATPLPSTTRPHTLQPWGLALTAQGLLRVNIQPTGQRP